MRYARARTTPCNLPNRYMNVVVVVEGDVFGGKVGKSGVGLRFSRWISAETRGGQAYGLCTILHKLSTFFDGGEWGYA